MKTTLKPTPALASVPAAAVCPVARELVELATVVLTAGREWTRNDATSSAASSLIPSTAAAAPSSETPGSPGGPTHCQFSGDTVFEGEKKSRRGMFPRVCARYAASECSTSSRGSRTPTLSTHRIFVSSLYTRPRVPSLSRLRPPSTWSRRSAVVTRASQCDGGRAVAAPLAGVTSHQLLTGTVPEG
eukprot:9176807-Pyramimonas_sp.AAC.1